MIFPLIYGILVCTLSPVLGGLTSHSGLDSHSWRDGQLNSQKHDVDRDIQLKKLVEILLQHASTELTTQEQRLDLAKRTETSSHTDMIGEKQTGPLQTLGARLRRSFSNDWNTNNLLDGEAGVADPDWSTVGGNAGVASELSITSNFDLLRRRWLDSIRRNRQSRRRGLSSHMDNQQLLESIG